MYEDRKLTIMMTQYSIARHQQVGVVSVEEGHINRQAQLVWFVERHTEVALSGQLQQRERA